MNLQEQFFILLRIGLWGGIADPLKFPPETNWKEIYRLSQQQTVVGVVYDGLSTLPTSSQPEPVLLRQWYTHVMKIEQSHELLDQQLTKIIPLMHSEGIYPVLLKGQGVAQNYPNPIRRQCGDIDLYVGKKDCKKATLILSRLGAQAESKTKKNNSKHESFYLNKVNIELHFLVEKLRNPFYNRRFQQWTEYHLKREKINTWHINSTGILLPPINFDALYIFTHIYHHFISGGVGLRQLCDWTLYLHAFRNKIEQQELFKDLKALGLIHAWQIFGHIAVEKLGLANKEFPFYTGNYNKHSQKILDNIFQTGNFGFYNPDHEKHPSGYFSGKLHSFSLKQKRLLSILPILPKDVLTFYLWYCYSGINNILTGK